MKQLASKGRVNEYEVHYTVGLTKFSCTVFAENEEDAKKKGLIQLGERFNRSPLYFASGVARGTIPCSVYQLH